MAHHCPTCSTVCYCGGDHSEILTGNRAYCMHCGDEPLDFGQSCASCGEHVPDHAEGCFYTGEDTNDFTTDDLRN